jgi:hypothetical protein
MSDMYHGMTTTKVIDTACRKTSCTVIIMTIILLLEISQFYMSYMHH